MSTCKKSIPKSVLQRFFDNRSVHIPNLDPIKWAEEYWDRNTYKYENISYRFLEKEFIYTSSSFRTEIKWSVIENDTENIDVLPEANCQDASDWKGQLQQIRDELSRASKELGLDIEFELNGMFGNCI